MHSAKSARALAALGASLVASAIAGTVNAETGPSRLAGIDSGSSLGIDSGSVLGIDSGSVTGIDSGSVLGIDSGSVTGIDSGSVLGIDSGSVTGIDSGSVLGIDSGSVTGIDSGSVLGIDSGSVTGIDSGSVLGIDSGSVTGIDSGSVLGGPVSSINAAEGFFSSMGQRISAPYETLMSLRIGDLVYVQGSLSGAGMIAASNVFLSEELYVPGATQVFVTGIPTSIDASLGIATIGDLKVDYTSSIGRSDFDGIGAAVTVIGIQPALGGKMIGSQVQDKTELFLRD